MPKSIEVRQWDVWFVDLRPGIKGEQTGKHHVVVLSGRRVNAERGIAVVAPITTTRRNWPWLVQIEAHHAGIRELSYIECDQLQAVATSAARFIEKRAPLAHHVRPIVAVAVEQVFGDLFAIADDER